MTLPTLLTLHLYFSFNIYNDIPSNYTHTEELNWWKKNQFLQSIDKSYKQQPNLKMLIFLIFITLFVPCILATKIRENMYVSFWEWLISQCIMVFNEIHLVVKDRLSFYDGIVFHCAYTDYLSLSSHQLKDIWTNSIS